MRHFVGLDRGYDSMYDSKETRGRKKRLACSFVAYRSTSIAGAY